MTTPQEAITAESKTGMQESKIMSEILEKHLGNRYYKTGEIHSFIKGAMEEYATKIASQEISKSNEEIVILRNEWDEKFLSLQQNKSEVRGMIAILKEERERIFHEAETVTEPEHYKTLMNLVNSINTTVDFIKNNPKKFLSSNPIAVEGENKQ